MECGLLSTIVPSLGLLLFVFIHYSLKSIKPGPTILLVFFFFSLYVHLESFV